MQVREDLPDADEIAVDGALHWLAFGRYETAGGLRNLVVHGDEAIWRAAQAAARADPAFDPNWVLDRDDGTVADCSRWGFRHSVHEWKRGRPDGRGRGPVALTDALKHVYRMVCADDRAYLANFCRPMRRAGRILTDAAARGRLQIRAREDERPQSIRLCDPSWFKHAIWDERFAKFRRGEEGHAGRAEATFADAIGELVNGVAELPAMRDPRVQTQQVRLLGEQWPLLDLKKTRRAPLNKAAVSLDIALYWIVYGDAVDALPTVWPPAGRPTASAMMKRAAAWLWREASFGRVSLEGRRENVGEWSPITEEFFRNAPGEFLVLTSLVRDTGEHWPAIVRSDAVEMDDPAARGVEWFDVSVVAGSLIAAVENDREHRIVEEPAVARRSHPSGGGARTPEDRARERKAIESARREIAKGREWGSKAEFFRWLDVEEEGLSGRAKVRVWEAVALAEWQEPGRRRKKI